MAVYISELPEIQLITNDDFFALVDSASLTTYRSNFNTLNGWMSSSVTTSRAMYANTASLANTASYAITSSFALTASYLLYRGFPNGTASYALTSSRAITASYFDISGVTIGFATYARSASWASHSLSSSYVPASGVDGTVRSASYAITASYAKSASYAITASHGISASYASSASFALYADNTSNNPVSIYGPFTASANVNSPTVGWSQWDYEKRAIAFTIGSTSDVVIECTINYAIDEDSGHRFYIGVILRADGLDDPTVNPVSSVSALDDFKFISVYDFAENARIDTTSKFYIKRNSLTAGNWVIYILPYKTDPNPNITPWGTSGIAQKSILDTFLASSPEIEKGQVRFYKFANSAMVNVYSTTPITQYIL